MMEIKLLVDQGCNLGEGPLWDCAEQKLYWGDSLDRCIFRCSADGTGLERWQLPDDIGSMAPARQERSDPGPSQRFP